MTSSGAMKLPIDLLIFRPSPSTKNPWVRTSRYGARPLVPTEAKRDEWNQPRCWSLPSRYMSGWGASDGLFSQTAA